MPRPLKRDPRHSDCWVWPRYIAPNGYGRVHQNGYAHRWVYEQLRGPIPDGLQIDHLCGNRSCVNPWHLEPVSCQENLLRADTVPARNAAKDECPNGHPYNKENTRIVSGETYGRARQCRACDRERARARRAAA